MAKIINDPAQKSLGIIKNSSLLKSWWNNQLTETYKKYRETRKTYTCRATPANHKKLKSSKKKTIQELIDIAKKHERAFPSEYLNTAQDSRQFWHMLDKVTRKKTINIVEPLIKDNNSYIHL